MASILSVSAVETTDTLHDGDGLFYQNPAEQEIYDIEKCNEAEGSIGLGERDSWYSAGPSFLVSDGLCCTNT